MVLHEQLNIDLQSYDNNKALKYYFLPSTPSGEKVLQIGYEKLKLFMISYLVFSIFLTLSDIVKPLKKKN